MFAHAVDNWRWFNPAKWLIWPFVHFFGGLAGLFRRRSGEIDQPEAEPSEAVEEAVEEESEAAEDAAGGNWPEERKIVIDGLWGEDTITPGVNEYIFEPVQLLGLSDANSLLYLAAGMGGPARRLNAETGIWVTGLEADGELAEIAAEKSRMSGQSKKAPVSLFDPENPEIKENSFNAVMGLECCYKVANKEPLFKAVAKGLRPFGMFDFTDFVVPRESKPTKEVMRWLARESVKPCFWTPEQVVGFLGGLNMEVQIAEDISDRYRVGVIKGWANFIAGLNKASLTANAVAIISECEYWLYRIAALDSGGVRLYRFRAEKLKAAR